MHSSSDGCKTTADGGPLRGLEPDEEVWPEDEALRPEDVELRPEDEEFRLEEATEDAILGNLRTSPLTNLLLRLLDTSRQTAFICSDFRSLAEDG